MKGYYLSKDYKKLFDLIHDGYRVPAWVLYSDEYSKPIYDLVEVKLIHNSERHSIGSRGVGYESFDSTFEAFKKNCESLELRYIVPDAKKYKN